MAAAAAAVSSGESIDDAGGAFSRAD